MDRRRFLAAGGLTAISPLWAHAATAAVPGTRTTVSGGPARPGAAPAMFTQVNFTADGLNLRPAEYAALLAETVTTGDLEADYYSLGGAIEQLEQTFARLLGKEAAMFVPTGTLANHLAVRTLAGNDRRVLVQAESHLYADSGDAATSLSNLNLIPLVPGTATLTVDDVRPWVERSAAGRVPGRIGAISVESPVRRLDHRMADFSELQRLSAYARGQGIRMHLDGARLFNLPQHSGHTIYDYTRLFDTVYVSLWKHFNAASGAILAGDAALIDGLYHARRMFGGSLPHAWPQVAVAQRFAASYEQDYAKAWQAAEAIIAGLRADGRFTIRKLEDGTSTFYMTVAGADHQKLAARARARGVILAPPPSGQSEFALQVNTSLLRMPPAKVAGVLLDALAG